MKKIIIATTTVLLLLSSCGSDSDSPENISVNNSETIEQPTPEASPENLKSINYSFNTPAGMKESTNEIREGNSFVDKGFLGSDEKTAVFVVKAQGVFTSIDSQSTKDSINLELSNSGFRDIEFLGFAELDGEQGLITTAVSTIEGEYSYLYQIFTPRAELNFVLSAMAPTPEKAKELGELAASTWKWIA